MLAVVKDHLARKQNGRRLELDGGYIGTGLRRVFPAPGLAAVITCLVALHLFDDSGVSHGRRSVIYPHLIAVCMIAVMVSVEREANWLVGQSANLRQDLSGTRRKICIDEQNVVFENYPAVVAVAAHEIAFVEVHVRRQRI